MTLLNAVISGYGVAGELHARLLATRADIRIAGIADPSPTRRALAEHRYPDAAIAYGLADLDVEADIVVVATPPHCHEAETETALTSHHAHVLCEKPAVLDPIRGRRLACIAAEQRLLIWPVHNYLYAPAIREARHLLRPSLIGRITHARAEIGRPAPSTGHTTWRTSAEAGGGILNDHGSHVLYILSYLLGRNAEVISCRTAQGDHGVEQAAWMELGYGETTCMVRLSWRSATRESCYQFQGTRGELTLRQGALTVTRPNQTLVFQTDDLTVAGHMHTTWTRALHAEFIARTADDPAPMRHWHQAVQLGAELQAARASACSAGSSSRVIDWVTDEATAQGCCTNEASG